MAFQELMNVLTALNESHTSLLKLAEAKKQVLIDNEVDKLMQIVSAENRLLKQIGELDQKRMDSTGKYMIEKGYKPNPKVTVSDLTKIVFNTEDKRALIEAQKQLLGTIRQLREKNKLNQQLIEHSLSFIDYSIDLISGPPEDGAIYHKPNSGSSSKRMGMFDTRA